MGGAAVIPFTKNRYQEKKNNDDDRIDSRPRQRLTLKSNLFYYQSHGLPKVSCI